MNKSFGPWSTSINSGAPQQLDTFWKSRLAMLPSLSKATSGMARRTLWFFAVLAVAAMALPTIMWATHATSAGPAVVVADESAQRIGSGKSAGFDRREKPDSESKGPDGAVNVEYLPRPSGFEEELLAALEKPISVEYINLPLQDCLQRLQETTRISIWLDKPTLTDEGVALDQPVTLKLHGARLESVLNLILKPVQLSYFPRDEVLNITTATKAGEHLITRTYPVRDLYQGLVDAITSTIQPDSWDELGGPGTYTYVKDTGCLVIRQTWSVHRQILRLLRNLREIQHLAPGGNAAPPAGDRKT